MKRQAGPITILIADDDADDRMLIKDAFESGKLNNKLEFVEDGEELLRFLRREGEYASMQDHAYPGLILLDLNMPKMDGREALKELKADPGLQRIPVVVLTTSEAEEDIVRTYGLGVNSFITKPVTLSVRVRPTTNQTSQRNAPRVTRFDASGEVRREDFGLGLGKVKLTLRANFIACIGSAATDPACRPAR